VSVLNGLVSQVSYASILPNGSQAQQIAQAEGLTVGEQFGPGMGNVAIASVNTNQIRIDPFMVNPGDPLGDTG
jgi:hypothetical protein